MSEAISLLTCSLLNNAATWNHLRHLKLTGLDSNFSFQHLRGRVPNLKRLATALQHSEVALADFISSINGLEELRITNYKGEIDLNVLCVAIVKHKASREKVSILLWISSSDLRLYVGEQIS